MRLFFLAGPVLGLALCAHALGAAAASTITPTHWVTSWGTAQMDPGGEAPPPAQWADMTLRQVVHVTLDARTVRVRFSNAYGTAPLVIDHASVAPALQSGRVDAGKMTPLRFGGNPRITIPAGAEYASDPVDLDHAAGAGLAVSLHLPEAPARLTGHPGSGATGYSMLGDHVLDADLPGATKVNGWFQLAAVEVMAAPARHTVVAIGDSITDGYGVPADSNTRWPDLLAARLRGAGMGQIGVVNAGITGNRLLRDGRGPNLAGRYARDVLDRAGVSHVIVMIGVNDLGVQHRDHADSVPARARLLEELKAALRQLADSAHARGVCAIGGTITPYAGGTVYQPNADNERDRQDYNAWIRTSGVFDGVVDFDAALRDPAHPDLLRAAYDNDGLHPNVAGYNAMAAAVLLRALQACARAVPGA